VNDLSPAADDSSRAAGADPSFRQFQQLIREMYLQKDLARGVDGTFMWLMEEVGELAGALRNGSHEDRLGEFADVLAWLTTIANVAGVDLAEAITLKCRCANAEKP
jgi:NTP pyrophosphatase (non-canonical NTP hydrolase)